MALHPDRLFPVVPALRDFAWMLYDKVRDLPIVSPHGHTDPRWLVEDAAFPDPAQLFVTPDHYGIDPVHFGVILILNLGIGLNTPPVGAVQFVACAMGKITLREAMRSIWPFCGAGLSVLLPVTYIPAHSPWLPALYR